MLCGANLFFQEWVPSTFWVSACFGLFSTTCNLCFCSFHFVFLCLFYYFFRLYRCYLQENYGASYTILAGKGSYSFFNQTLIYNVLCVIYNVLCVRFYFALVSINCFFCFININRLTHNTISGRYNYFLYFTN